MTDDEYKIEYGDAYGDAINMSEEAADCEIIPYIRFIKIKNIYINNPSYIYNLECISSDTREHVLDFINCCNQIQLKYIFINDKTHTIKNFRYYCNCDNTFKKLPYMR